MRFGISDRRATDREVAKLQAFVQDLPGKGHREARHLLQSVEELATSDDPDIDKVRIKLKIGLMAIENRLTGIGAHGLARSIPQCLRDVGSLSGNPDNQKRTAQSLLPAIRQLLPTLKGRTSHPPSPS